jgi:hypothetical protein
MGTQKFNVPMEAPNDDNDGSDAVCNAFEFAEALYWHCVHNYDGMSSLEYLIHCNLEFTPSPFATDTNPENMFLTLFGDDCMMEFIADNHAELLSIIP